MKISAINMPIYFNGTNKDYKKEVEEKSNKQRNYRQTSWKSYHNNKWNKIKI